MSVERGGPAVCNSSDAIDRKSTRLNSSHLVISYAVFCLKKVRRVRGQQIYPLTCLHIGDIFHDTGQCRLYCGTFKRKPISFLHPLKMFDNKFFFKDRETEEFTSFSLQRTFSN